MITDSHVADYLIYTTLICVVLILFLFLIDFKDEFYLILFLFLSKFMDVVKNHPKFNLPVSQKEQVQVFNMLVYVSLEQVCEKASNPKLVELLLSSGPREQDVRKALTISIGKGDGQTISLLLRRLALDLANNSICLGGFGIGKIEPSWLGPLFPDKTFNSRKETSKYLKKKTFGMCYF